MHTVQDIDDFRNAKDICTAVAEDCTHRCILKMGYDFSEVCLNPKATYLMFKQINMEMLWGFWFVEGKGVCFILSFLNSSFKRISMVIM